LALYSFIFNGRVEASVAAGATGAAASTTGVSATSTLGAATFLARGALAATSTLTEAETGATGVVDDLEVLTILAIILIKLRLLLNHFQDNIINQFFITRVLLMDYVKIK